MKTSRTFAAGDSLWSVAVGDFNSDGKPDLRVPDLAPPAPFRVVLNSFGN